MKLLDTFSVTLVLWLANKVVDSIITCPKDKYILVENGTESCLTCNPCPHGFGLSPPCGSKVHHPPPIDCVPCVPGKTYSNEYGPSSCKNCHICSANEIVTRNCTASENTICSNICKESYYYDNITHQCQLCSDCCNKDNDITIKECKSMTPYKQCSIHSAQQCKPKPTNTVTHYHTTTGTLSTNTPKESNTDVIVGCVIGGAVVGVILIIVLVLLYKRRKKSKRRSINGNVTYNRRGDHDVEHQVLFEDDQCNLNHLKLSVINDTPNQLTEGQKISLTIDCDIQNGNNNRKCNLDFEWKKDGLSIPNNNYQKSSKTLIIEDVDIADSGQYYCETHCNKHRNADKGHSETVKIQVKPREGTDLKLFGDLDWNTQTKIANWLKPKTVGIGDWMVLGIEFGIDEDALKALDKEQAPSQVLENIKCQHPDLTVFDFWEKMKSDSMKQNKIAKFLQDQLINKPKEPTKSGIDAITRPDSGIEEDSDVPLRVNLPPEPASSKSTRPKIPALDNLGHVDSSREASRESSLEDLSSPFLNNVQNSRKPMEDKVSKGLKTRILRRKKSVGSRDISDENDDFKDDKDQDEKSNTGKTTRYGRQTSKDSQKSDDIQVSGTREQRRSRSSSIASSIKEMVLKQPSVEYSALDQHHESDEGV